MGILLEDELVIGEALADEQNGNPGAVNQDEANLIDDIDDYKKNSQWLVLISIGFAYLLACNFLLISSNKVKPLGVERHNPFVLFAHGK